MSNKKREDKFRDDVVYKELSIRRLNNKGGLGIHQERCKNCNLFLPTKKLNTRCPHCGITFTKLAPN